MAGGILVPITYPSGNPLPATTGSTEGDLGGFTATTEGCRLRIFNGTNNVIVWTLQETGEFIYTPSGWVDDIELNKNDTSIHYKVLAVLTGSTPQDNTIRAVFYAQAQPLINPYRGPLPGFSGAGGAGQLVFNVKNYGATGNGNTDDTTAIQNAITAAQNAGGGIVFLPSGTYSISARLLVSHDNIEVVGAGWSSIITPNANFTNPSALLVVGAPGGAGNFRYGIRVAELFFDCANNANASGLDLQSTYGALMDHVRVRNVASGNTGVLWDGIAAAFGAYNEMRDCRLTDGAGTGLNTLDSEWLLIRGCHFGFWNNANAAIACKISNLNCTLIGNQFDHNDTSIQLFFAGRAQVSNNQFDRGANQYIDMHGCKNCMVADNLFASANQGSGANMISVTDVGTTGNVVIGNDAVAGGAWTYFLAETAANLNAPQNLYTSNQTGGYPIFRTLGTGTGIARGNTPYNPVGPGMTQPAVPTSGTPLTNTTGLDATVVINALNTLTAVALGGTTVPGAPASGSSYRVPSGQTITPTYGGAAPTWQWFGD